MTGFEKFKQDCMRDADVIFVRDKLEGKWGSYSLAQLPAERQEYWIQYWWERFDPIRIRRENDQ